MKPKPKPKVIKAWMVTHRNDGTIVYGNEVGEEPVVSVDKEYLEYHWSERIFKIVPIEIRLLK